MVVPFSVGSQTAMVLVVDPDPASQREMRSRLMSLGYTARLADDYESAAAIVSATPPDVILALGQHAQGKGWSDLQAQLNSWGIPVVRLAERDEEANTLESAASKISDADLKLRLDAALQTRSLQGALLIENARLSAERLHDPLTGLFNRRYAMIRVEEEIKRSSRRSYPLSCLLVDIDKFDAVNDAWGHLVGDGVLRDMAHIVTRTLRASDIVARYRDDEFLALLTDTDAQGAQVAANRLRDAVADHNFFNRGSSGPIRLTASIGIAYWQPSQRPGEGTWEPQLIALAERALKAAKLSGANRLVMLQAA